MCQDPYERAAAARRRAVPDPGLDLDRSHAEWVGGVMAVLVLGCLVGTLVVLWWYAS